MAQTALQAGVEQKRALLDFVLQLGRAMNQPGAAVSETQERLERIAAAYGARGARIVVLPTTLIVSLGRAETGTIEKVPQVGTLLRLDQISDLFELVGRAERARVSGVGRSLAPGRDPRASAPLRDPGDDRRLRDLRRRHLPDPRARRA